VFFYCNATGFASSLVVIILILLLSVQHEDMSGASIWRHTLVPLRVVMALDLLSILGAYAATTCQDAVTTTYSTLLVVGVRAVPIISRALGQARQ